MNIYKELNNVIEYIENHLQEEIDYKKLAKKIGTNEYTFQRIFSILCNITVSEYIRNRRLSNAGQDLFLGNEKVVDLSIKYGYNNATSFSRAFEKFHGIKPSEVRKSSEKLKLYPKLHFNEKYEHTKNIEYEIVEKEELILYGIYVKTDNEKIKKDAPMMYEKNTCKYGKATYGMVEYHDITRENVKAYWILYDRKIEEMEKIVIPKGKWIKIKIDSQEAEDIQRVSDTFYNEFFISCKFTFKDLPELEYYHDGITDFLIPIKD